MIIDWNMTVKTWNETAVKVGGGNAEVIHRCDWVA